MARLVLPLLSLLLLITQPTWASENQAWIDRLGAVAVQDGGRVMPIDTFARRLAVELTGREHWSANRGPEAFADRHHVELLCDIMVGGRDVLERQLIAIDNRPFKKLVGLDPERTFFSAMEIAGNKAINQLLDDNRAATQADSRAVATRDQRRAIALSSAINRVAALAGGEPLALVPTGAGKPFLNVGLSHADPGTEKVVAALRSLSAAYSSKAALDEPVAQFAAAINAAGQLDPVTARGVGLELFYDRHDPWRKTTLLYGLAIVLFGLSRLMWRKPLVTAAIIATGLGIAEHLLGIGLRIAILQRAPVSNTFESLLWMGLVAIALGVIAQFWNRSGNYVFGGVCAAFISVIFAGMVPLADRTNSLPAVLRSNFWLTIHVLTIVASYGVLAVASVLGHVYLAKEVLFRRQSTDAPAAPANRSHTLIVQTYRSIQVGLLLLTAGTILGGVWAADSWGRFWGWDPKETWALVSIVLYFAILHARYIRWFQDFGLAAAAVVGFVAIVWTFYGVNYVMATGLHSYGFGSGGEVWVGAWALGEILFVIACRLRYKPLEAAAPKPTAVPPSFTAGQPS